MTLPRIGLVGTGAVSRAVALAHRGAGGVVAAVVSRDARRAETFGAAFSARGGTDASLLAAADVTIVCVPDRAVAEVGERIADALGSAAPLVVHTSGALPGTSLLERRPSAAVRAGSLHPLQSFPAHLAAGDADAALAARVAGVHWFHEGAGAEEGRTLVAAWGGRFHALAPGGKVLYHAGAAVLSNHAVALFADASRLLGAAGVPAEAARPALAALLAGTAANLSAVGVPAALTGPVARGDVATVRRHADALAAAAPDLLEAYRALARRAVVVAREKGSIDAATEAELRAVLGASG